MGELELENADGDENNVSVGPGFVGSCSNNSGAVPNDRRYQRRGRDRSETGMTGRLAEYLINQRGWRKRGFEIRVRGCASVSRAGEAYGRA